MAYPTGVKTRMVSFGGAATVEAGTPLDIRISTVSSRSLIWVAEGYRLESLAASYQSALEGDEILFEVPTTDQSGWLDAETRQAIIVEPGQASHLYTTTLDIFQTSGEKIRTYTIGPYAVPDEPGVLDGDLINSEFDPVEGVLTNYVPGPEGPPGLDGSNVLPTDEAIAQAIVTEGSETQTQLNAAIVNVASGIIPTGVVTSPQVNRIVAVIEGEPKPTLNDGDLLVTYATNGNLYYKDFANDTAGPSGTPAPPSGMTKLLDADANVRTFSEGTGGQVLDTPSNGVAAYSLDAADLDEYYEDAEFLVRWRAPSAHGVSVFFNVDPVTDSFDRITYNTVSGEGRVRWTARREGVNVYTPQDSTILAVEGSWYFLRARYANGFIRGKVWADGSSEPSEWAYSREVEDLIPPLPMGKHAVGSVGVYNRIDYLVHATGGKVAVKP